MDDRRWRRIDALFDAALELPAEGREELLDRECGDEADLRRAVERLLALETEAEGFLSEPLGLSSADELVDMRIGPYRLIRLLGHGGMGSVYLAQRQHPYRQEVAIKLVRRSFLSREARRRLHTERQALARLEHPYIARLYDGGTTDDGIPYLVMERVVGLPIDRYCDARALSVRRRLELVREVLSAVAHAHQHLRVHCDIKPSNVLVTEGGTPKLLDFGIAKLLSPDERADLTVTLAGRRPMTLGYASPEQILGRPITTATDIYSVGVLLGELLCGSLPYAAGDPELDMDRVIVEKDPVAPSRQVATAAVAARRGVTSRELESQLRGDLDAIVMKAIRKEPARRYAGAEAFADDLTRYLEARPVKARRGTWRYRAGRFLRRLALPPDRRRRRERWAWATVLLAVAGLSPFALSLRRPPAPCQDSARDLAGVWDAGRRVAVERAFLATSLPFAQDTWSRVAAALDRHARAWIATDAEICAATLVRGERSPRLLDLGRLCLDGRREELRALTDLFVDADETLVIEAVSAVNQLGSLADCADQAELATRRLPPADPALRRRLERVRAVVEAQHLRLRIKQPVDFAALRRAETELRQLDDPPLVARLLYVLGLAETFERAEQEAGEAHLEEALLAAITGGDRPQQTRIYAALLKTLARQGNLERARFWERFATASLAALSPGNHDVEVAVFEALGLFNWEAGHYEASREYLRRALASAEREGDPIEQISAHNQLGMVEDGPTHLGRAIEIIERELGPDHPRLASPLMNLAASRAFGGRYDEALALARRSLDLVRAARGDEHPDLGFPLTLIGQILIAQDRPREALAPLRRAVERIEAGHGSNAPMVRDVHVALAEALLFAGRLDNAFEHLRKAEATLEAGLSADHPSRLNLLRVLGDARRLSGDLEAALASHEELLLQRQTKGAKLDARSLLAVARTLVAARRSGEAIPLLEAALSSAHDSDRWVRARIRLTLAEALAGEDPERARRLVAEARSGLSEELAVHRELRQEIGERWGTN